MSEKERLLLQYQLERVHERAKIEDARKRRRIRWELEAEDMRREALIPLGLA